MPCAPLSELVVAFCPLSVCLPGQGDYALALKWSMCAHICRIRSFKLLTLLDGDLLFMHFCKAPNFLWLVGKSCLCCEGSEWQQSVMERGLPILPGYVCSEKYPLQNEVGKCRHFVRWLQFCRRLAPSKTSYSNSAERHKQDAFVMNISSSSNVDASRRAGTSHTWRVYCPRTWHALYVTMTH